MKQTISIAVGKYRYEVPNSWELLTQEQFIYLISELERVATGKLSIAMLRANYLCKVMDWNPEKIDEAGFANLSWLAEQIDFIFNIAYPNNNAALESLDPHTKKLLLKTPPERMPGNAIARYLSGQDYKYVIDACFCRQLIPELEVDGTVYPGYRIDTSFNNLTCSLTALQYIEARRLLNSGIETLPLLAAILYLPGAYDSEHAHRFAKKISSINETVLQAIAFNFQAFNNYLFSKTDFFILTAGTSKTESNITTGALESLYNLSADGLGDISVIEQMNIIKYLTILRKKLIESVHALSGAKMEHSEIATKTGLPLSIINDILK